MSRGVAGSPFIRLARPPEGVLPKRNYLAHVGRSIGCAGEHLLAELWPADKVPVETCDHANRETQLADLLRILRDERQDIGTRIAAAEEALRIKAAQSLTINIVKYVDPPEPERPDYCQRPVNRES